MKIIKQGWAELGQAQVKQVAIVDTLVVAGS